MNAAPAVKLANAEAKAKGVGGIDMHGPALAKPKAVDPKALAKGTVKAVPFIDVYGEDGSEAFAGDLAFIGNYCKGKRSFSIWVAREMRDGSLFKRYKQSQGLCDIWPVQQKLVIHCPVPVFTHPTGPTPCVSKTPALKL